MLESSLMIGFTIFGVVALAAFCWPLIAISNLIQDTEIAALRLKKTGNFKPRPFLPLARIKEITKDDLLAYSLYALKVQEVINKGETRYSSLEAKGMLSSLKLFAALSYFSTRHPVLFGLFILSCLPLGFIPFIIFIMVQAVHFRFASKAEVAVNQYLNGTLTNNKKVEANSSVGLSDELKKLLDLKQSGALSEQEFSALKERLIKAG